MTTTAGGRQTTAGQPIAVPRTPQPRPVVAFAVAGGMIFFWDMCMNYTSVTLFHNSHLVNFGAWVGTLAVIVVGLCAHDASCVSRPHSPSRAGPLRRRTAGVR